MFLNTFIHLVHQIIAAHQVLLTSAARTAVPLTALLAGSYVLIIRPQREQRRQTRLITRLLRPGAAVQTANGLGGTAIFVTHNSVIIELATGQKVEVLKQAITAVAHDQLP